MRKLNYRSSGIFCSTKRTTVRWCLFVKPEYFEDHHERIIYEEVWNFASSYDTVPTSEVLIINLQDRKDITEEAYNLAVQTLKTFEDTPVEHQWLLDTTEKWCKDRAIYLALLGIDQDC